MRKIAVVVMMVVGLWGGEYEELLASLQAQAPLPFDAARGEAIFDQKVEKEGEMINCRSCHGADLKAQAKNFKTGKLIEPLAPSANPERLTSQKEMKKWLKRNFKDVYSREGTPQEQGDVLVFLKQQ
ncbi:MAG: hypothetical protein KU37_07030 [Sulfuricurvum sp. PC08-66]|nr:MAG: hypothetical protein KU37_07030 [Sulfuricurvum sp. PC08-66]